MQHSNSIMDFSASPFASGVNAAGPGNNDLDDTDTDNQQFFLSDMNLNGSSVFENVFDDDDDDDDVETHSIVHSDLLNDMDSASQRASHNASAWLAKKFLREEEETCFEEDQVFHFCAIFGYSAFEHLIQSGYKMLQLHNLHHSAVEEGPQGSSPVQCLRPLPQAPRRHKASVVED
ncbi:CLL_HP2_G0014960.mRNA.1.CDS.1 [Saccharomyces cerevisiae]|nr:CLL_HP2_G0014960.mRNA.1.CDS.1 [Saccharomyces cerevisiae]CAI6509280.1 CLL_HP2_G0014960.mRNA.1.CDS.1 [Saccharomyces cerevisiae]